MPLPEAVWIMRDDLPADVCDWMREALQSPSEPLYAVYFHTLSKS